MKHSLNGLCATLMFLPHFEVNRDLLKQNWKRLCCVYHGRNKDKHSICTLAHWYEIIQHFKTCFIYLAALLLLLVWQFSIRLQFSYCNILGPCPINFKISKVLAISLDKSWIRPWLNVLNRIIVKGAQSRYFELFYPRTKLALNWRKPENSS